VLNRENPGFYLQKCAVKDKGADLVPWIQIGRLGSTRNGLTRGCGLTGRLGRVVAVGSASSGHGAARARDGGVLPAASAERRRAAASGGAGQNRGWGAPTGTGIALRRRARAGKPTGGPHKRRR
jgi:hypothetical protein